MYDLVDVNSGLWYGFPSLLLERTSRQGEMPEPEMEHNCVRLYKTHDDTFQIILTLKPKIPTPKKNQQ